MPAPRPDEQRVKELIAEVYMRSPRDQPLRWQEIASDGPLYSGPGDADDSLGLDSLDAVEIATELEEAFDVVLPAEIDPTEIRTVRQVVALLERLVAQQRGASA